MKPYCLLPLIQGVLTAGNGAKKPADPTITLWYIGMFLCIGVAFYLIMVRPVKKEQADRNKLLTQLKKGDKVVTIGGIHGTIAEIEGTGDTVILEVAKNIRIKFLRSAISTVVARASDTTEEKG